VKHLVTLALTLCLGCARTEHPQKVAVTDRLPAPVVLTLEETSRGADKAVLVARVRRQTTVPLELLLRVTLPDGATLAQGAVQEVFPPQAELGETTRTLVLQYAALPAGDLLVHLDGETKGLGVHATVPYRFGRPAPVEAHLAPEGDHVFKNGRDLGAPVPVR
jgi:hypothetical protein